MSFVSKECLDKELLLLAVSEKQGPSCPFLEGLNFSYYERRKQSL